MQQIDALTDLQRKLAESEILREEFLHASYDGYWDWHLKTGYEYMSPRFWEILGYDPGEMRHDPSEWQKIIFQEDLELALENFKKHIETKGEHLYSQVVRYRHKNGSTVTVLCRGKVIDWDKNGEPLRMIGTHTDITEIKRSQESLRKKNAELEQFVYIASHDLQAPLRHISSFIDVLKDSLASKLSPDEAKYMDIIQNGSFKMKKLISDLSELTQIGISEIQKGPVNLSALIKKSEQNVRAEHPDVQFDCLIPQLPHIRANEVIMERIFTHLIDNAVKYRNSAVPLKIELSCVENQDSITIFVRDNGIGFDPSHRKRIFDVFHRLNKNDNIQGTGIGLAICKKGIECHQGIISADASPNAGAVISIEIPHNKI